MKLGTLIFCLDYAHFGGWGASGVWKDVQQAYSGRAMEELHSLLLKVNEFRNKHVAHVEEPVKDSDQAWRAMVHWLKCLDLMARLGA